MPKFLSPIGGSANVILDTTDGTAYPCDVVDASAGPGTFTGTPDLQVVRDATIVSATSTVHSASANFTDADVGKVFVFDGAGALGVPLLGSITGRLSSTAVSISTPAGTSVPSGGTFAWGTDNAPALQSAVTAAAPTGELVIPAGGYIFASGVLLPSGLTVTGMGELTYLCAAIAQGALSQTTCLFFAAPKTTGANQALTSNAAIGATQVVVGGTPFAKGDEVQLFDSANIFKGSRYTVLGVSGSQTLTLDRALLQPYTSATGVVAKITEAPTGIHVRNMRITGTAQRYVELWVAKNCSVADVDFDDSILMNVETTASFDTYGVSCFYEHNRLEGPAGIWFETNELSTAEDLVVNGRGNAGTEAGILVNDSVACTVALSEVSNHGFGVQFATGGTSACFDCVAESVMCVGNGVGFVISDADNTHLTDCTGKGGRGGLFVDLNGGNVWLTSAAFNSNSVQGLQTQFGSKLWADGLDVGGNGDYGMHLFGDARIRNVTSLGGTNNFYVLSVDTAGGGATNVEIEGFDFTQSTTAGYPPQASGIQQNGAAGSSLRLHKGALHMTAAVQNSIAINLSAGNLLDIDDMTIDGNGIVANNAIDTAATSTLRINKLRESAGMTIGGFCSRSFVGAANAAPLTGTGAVAWPDLQATDRVFFTRLTLGGSGVEPTVAYTPGTGFTATYVAGDTSTWHYEVR